MTTCITTLLQSSQRLKIFMCSLTVIFSTSCVSTLLKEPAPKFSSEVILPEPNSGYEKNTDSNFPTWKHKSTGVMLSVFSDCENPEVNLNEAHRLVSESVESSKMQSEARETIGGKKVFVKSFTGEIEAQPIEVWTATFRNDRCVYISSLSGHPKKPEQLKAEWYQFIENIKFKK